MHDDTVIKLTPKGIVAINLMQCGMVKDLDDPLIQLFWNSFEEDLRMFGYVIQEVKN